MTHKKALIKLLDVVEAAIKSGDWKVDGACDPDSAIASAKKALEQQEKICKLNIVLDKSIPPNTFNLVKCKE